MEIKKIKNDEKYVYNIEGRIDTQTAPELQKAVDESFDAGEINLVFNFDKVEYLSSAGLRIILYIQKKVDALKDDSASFEIINVKPQIMEVIDMTGFSDIVKVTPAS